jgi:hypothetical protein
MKKIRLEAAGSFGTLTDGGKDRPALLVYAGKFESMDGPVEVTPEQITLLVKNHNARLEKLGSKARMKDYPPIMLDHSTSARDVVGRLVGPIALGDNDGLPAIHGNVRILGKDNIERVEDGRWTHLSIGADLEEGVLHELTITPFPAAANAALLSKEAAMARKKLGTSEAPKGVTTGEPTDEKKNLSKDDDEDDKKLSREEGENVAHEQAENEKEIAHPVVNVVDGIRGAAEEPKQDDDKLGCHKLSDNADADDKTKLNDDEDEDEKELKKLSGGFAAKAASVRLAMRKNSIMSRLSALRSEAKITPAEMKKIDLARLASATDATIDAVLESYKQRQPVIHTGVFGTMKAETAAQLAAKLKNKELSKLEAESRARFSSLGKKGQTKMTGMEQNEGTTAFDKKVMEAPKQPGQDEDTFDAFARMIREGRDEEARAMFAHFTAEQKVGSTVAEMSALQSDFEELMGQFDTYVKLSAKRRITKV